MHIIPLTDHEFAKDGGFFFFLKFSKYMTQHTHQESLARDFPGSPVGKNPPCNAGTQVRALIKELRFPHVVEPLCLHAPAREPRYHDERFHMMQ